MTLKLAPALLLLLGCRSFDNPLDPINAVSGSTDAGGPGPRGPTGPDSRVNAPEGPGCGSATARLPVATYDFQDERDRLEETNCRPAGRSCEKPRRNVLNACGDGAYCDPSGAGAICVSFESSPQIAFAGQGGSLRLYFDLTKTAAVGAAGTYAGYVERMARQRSTCEGDEGSFNLLKRGVFNCLTFWVRGESPSPLSADGLDFEVGLKSGPAPDGVQTTDKVKVSRGLRACTLGPWQQVRLPLRELLTQRVDQTQLWEVNFGFQADRFAAVRRATVYLDEVAFELRPDCE